MQNSSRPSTSLFCEPRGVSTIYCTAHVVNTLHCPYHLCTCCVAACSSHSSAAHLDAVACLSWHHTLHPSIANHPLSSLEEEHNPSLMICARPMTGRNLRLSSSSRFSLRVLYFFSLLSRINKYFRFPFSMDSAKPARLFAGRPFLLQPGSSPARAPAPSQWRLSVPAEWTWQPPVSLGRGSGIGCSPSTAVPEGFGHFWS